LQRSRTAETRSALSQRTCAIALHAVTIPHVNGNASTNIRTIFRVRIRLVLRRSEGRSHRPGGASCG
jgi:hypothetical protein